MALQRSYYAAKVSEFLVESEESILGKLSTAHHRDLEQRQLLAWQAQIRFLKDHLEGYEDGFLFFEYSIPRMGKRVDNILLCDGRVFVIEFKVGADAYHHSDQLQVLDYALDLKNFHAASHDAEIVPILVATKAPTVENDLRIYDDQVWAPVLVNEETFSSELEKRADRMLVAEPVAPYEWQSSGYSPTPTIVEAAQALYRGHDVEEIARSEAANIGETTDAVAAIIQETRSQNGKAVVFVTGVPGSGKTLTGLNLASEHFRIERGEHAVFLSGNGPLVDVLQEALARYEHEHSDLRKSEALQRARAFIQNIHHFRDEGLMSKDPPPETVAVFDEAQRAWDVDRTSSWMSQRKGIPDFGKSEPEFLLEIMDRNPDWPVVVCLIGGGQEINTGEAGLPEWFRTLGEQFPDWEVYVSPRLTEYEYQRGRELYSLVDKTRLHRIDSLHLATSIRSFRSEYLSAFVKSLLDLDQESSVNYLEHLEGKYPINVSRGLERAKRWIREQARGSERHGLIASSGAHRLRPYGINVKASIDAPTWFLNDDMDVRSSYYLEEVATEFDIQGLELDWTIVGWDADLRYEDGHWGNYRFWGTEWQNVNDRTRQDYLLNAYRVLLTRARQGMVIFVPEGDSDDWTRPPRYYDGTFTYLRSLGIRELR